jgi:hypothetical protein
LNAGSADFDAPDGAVRELYPNLLEVRKKTAAGNSSNFFTDPAFFFGHTPAGNGPADNGSFSANFTNSHFRSSFFLFPLLS